MRSCKVGLGVLVCLLAVVSTSLGSSLPMVFTESPVLAQTLDARKAEADRLFLQGIEQLKKNQLEAALQSFQQALKIYREIKDRKAEGNALGNLGITYLSMKNYPKAIEYLEEGFILAKETKNRKLQSEVLPSILFIQRLNDRRFAEANLLLDQSVLMSNTSQFKAAIELNQQALKIYREIKEPISEATALNNIGINDVFLGNYERGIGYIEQSLAMARKNSDPLNENRALGNLGIAYRRKGDYPKAIYYFQQQLAIAREIEDSLSELKVLANLGNVYQNQEDYEQAISYHEQSLAIARKMYNRLQEGMAIGNIGHSYSLIGNYGKAIELIQQSIAIAEEVNNPYGKQLNLSILGSIYHSFGEYSKAKEYYLKSLEIAKQIGDREAEAGVLGDIGYVYNSQGDHKTAISYHEQHLAIARAISNPASESQALSDLGGSYFYLGYFIKAIDYYEQSLDIARAMKVSESGGLMNLGNIYDALGDSTKAIDYLQQSVAIERKTNTFVGLGKALHNLGVAFKNQGNLLAAEKALTEAIQVRESIRVNSGNNLNRVLVFDTLANTYRILQEVLVAQNKTDAALEISEAGRARALVDSLAKFDNYNQTQPKQYQLKIEQIKQVAKTQNSTIVQYSTINYKSQVEGQVKTEESELYIWVIKPTGEVTFRKADFKALWQKDKTNLEQLVQISRQSIGVRGAKMENPPPPNPENQKKRLQKLHEILISPIADLLPKKETDKVVFIPQSSLFLVPFPALQDKNGKYLIEKHTILTSPSIQVLDLTKKQYQKLGNQPLQSKNMLIVGNPIMPKVTIKIGDNQQKLPPLPEAEKEAKAIANLFKTQPLIGKQATESTVVQRLPQAQIIHFATHGLFDDIRGLDSSIALTPENPNSLSSPLSKEEQKRDGLLTAEEIFGLELKANLVVLSACDTGRGRITGDGVIGLSRSFISAGVPSVIVSLWSVDDGSTAFLMTEFYQNLQQKMDKATALRKAMLDTKKKYSNPSQWAAFTLIGESQ
ncbi:CHAT domain-containing protein [Aulosira sp. FACHB-113]|nr:CHAT domain-containing protein [Aulosira sp. FACHB-113]